MSTFSSSTSTNDGFVEAKSKSTTKQEHWEAEALAQLTEWPFNWGPLQDLENFSPDDLKLLTTEGPTMTVICDGKVARSKVHKRAFMAVSPASHKYLIAHPLTSEVLFDGCDRETVCQILKVLEEDIANFCLPFCKTFTHAVLVLQAARAMGLDRYATPVRKYLQTSISKRLLSYEELNIFLQRIRADDAVYAHLAADLAHRRYKKQVPDSEEFESFLGMHDELKVAMTDVDKEYSAPRKERRKEHFRSLARERWSGAPSSSFGSHRLVASMVFDRS